MKKFLSPYFIVATVACFGCIVVFIDGAVRESPTPPRVSVSIPWFQIAHVAGDYRVSCPVDYHVHIDGESIICSSHDGTKELGVDVRSTTAATVDAWIAIENKKLSPDYRLVVLGEEEIGGTRGVVAYRAGDVSYLRLASDWEKNVYVVRHARVYSIRHTADSPDERQFLRSFGFLSE